MLTDNYDISILKEMGFKFRSKRRYVLHTNFNQFIAINAYNDGFLLEVDGKLILSNKLSLDSVTYIINQLFLNEKREGI